MNTSKGLPVPGRTITRGPVGTDTHPVRRRSPPTGTSSHARAVRGLTWSPSGARWWVPLPRVLRRTGLRTRGHDLHPALRTLAHVGIEGPGGAAVIPELLSRGLRLRLLNERRRRRLLNDDGPGNHRAGPAPPGPPAAA